jgi:glycosyltransferase involved in cell wall biosynthesis
MTRRIAIVYQPQLDIGGVETLLISLFQRIDPQKYSFLVIAPVSAGFQSRATAPNVAFTPIPLYKPHELWVYSHILKLLRQEKIDLVHAHSPIAALPGRLAARLAGIPAVVSVQIPATRYFGTRQTARARLGRGIYIQLDRVFNRTITSQLIFASHRIYAETIRYGYAPESRSIFIPNGINLAPYQSARSRQELRNNLGLPQSKPIVTFVGRLVTDKGVDILFDALTKLGCSGSNEFHLCLVGGGPLENDLKTRAKELELEKTVHFCGYCDNVLDYLLASDCFVLPSRNEAMSLAVLEAMAAGLPCVVSDIGDHADLVQDGVHGYVIPPDSPIELANALNRLLCDDMLRHRMGEVARDKAQGFSDIRMAKKIEEIYDRILPEKPIAPDRRR